MNSSPGASPDIEKPPLARVSTSPSLSTNDDIESLRDFRKGKFPGVKRASTFSTLSSTIAEEDSFARRKETLVSNESEQVSPNLERTPTLLPEDEALHGYPRLATFLGGQEGYSIYKRFASLNARNLLYHQAKLIHLEHELNELEQAHAKHADLHYKVHHIFDARPDTPGFALHTKYEQVSQALDKYNGLLLEQQKLHELPSPDDAFVESIHNYINNTSTPNPEWLEHPENTIYAVWDDNRKPLQRDLVTLNRELRTQDAFTKFFTGTVLNKWDKIYRRFKKPDDDMEGYRYTETALSRYMRAVVMVMASGLPTCSIVALYFIDKPLWRLVFVILFSGVFAACLVIFTDAKRVDIFTASLALASVQVVFIGTAFGNGNAKS